jgi:flagellar biosynthesis protein FlhF
MKIKRFVAQDMRQAMRLVREEQGPDAVILSTRRLDDGIEIIAAVDYDEALVREAARHGAPLPAAPRQAEAPVVEGSAAGAGEARLQDRGRRPLPPGRDDVAGATSVGAASGRDRPDATLHRAANPTPPADIPASPAAAPSRARAAEAAAPNVTRMDNARAAAPAKPAAPARPAAAPGEPAQVLMHPLIERAAADTRRLRAELNSMREMLELQLSSLAWNDMERRHPLRARVLRELTRLGIDADVARRLADELPQEINPEQARYLPLGLLSRALPVGLRGRGEEGGVLALVGPTGVGKTTTLAKLAARAVRRHGPGQVALVSTDHYRIGAAAQLEHYGRLLGVRVYPADDAASLRQVLRMLEGKHTVLVDTAGLAGSDPRLEQQMDVLNEVAHGGDTGLHACVVLAANAQSQSLDEAVRAYLPLEPHACILTKLDEAPCLGGALSALIRHRLPLDYTTDGQRVPEDIAVADARALVCRAAKALRSNAPAEDDLMAERFGFAVAQA